MAEPVRETNNPEIVLRLLTSIEHDSGITQRKLAGHLGIALGLANSYLRRCARKGLVKISQVPLNRYAYYLTPQGFAEKSRLMAEYLAVSFDFFRRARNDCTDLLHHCSASGWRRVVLYGASDLAEIAVLSAGEAAVDVVCIIDPDEAGGRRAGLPVVATLADAQAIAGDRGLDGIVVTDTRAAQDCFDRLRESAETHGLAPASIVAPKLLGISLAVRSPMADEEATQ